MSELRERALTLLNETQTGKAENPLRYGDEIFRLLVESVRDYAIFLLDPSGHVASWNQGAERIKGYKTDEILGEHFSCFYPREARESRWPDRELEIAGREGRFVDEGLRVRKDGSTFWAYVVITALYDGSGELRGFAKVTRDLTEQRELEERTRLLNKELRSRVRELLESQRQVELHTFELQRLSTQLLRVQDEERRRIAGALHDDVGQELAAIKIEMDDLVQLDFDKSGRIARLSQIADSVLGKIRSMTYLLHPPLLDESGLLPALHWYFEGLQKRSELNLSFDYKPFVFPRLSPDIEMTVFRIVQESLTNIYRHSGSKEAKIELQQNPDSVTVRIRDFGKGIPDIWTSFKLVPGVGISGMRQRVQQLNGEFKVNRAEPGTLVEAILPIVQ